MNILYLRKPSQKPSEGEKEQEDSLVNMIHQSVNDLGLGTRKLLARNAKQAYSWLPPSDLVVMVGNPMGVFGGENVYDRFVRWANENKTPIVGVAPRGQVFPLDNKGISEMVYTDGYIDAGPRAAKAMKQYLVR